MIKKKMVLADVDEQYLKELRYEFMEKAPQLDLITFTKKEKIYEYFEQGSVADILVIDEGFAEEILKMPSLPVTKIALSSSMDTVEGFHVLKKYQRMESLLNGILLKYAQDSGTLEVVRGDSDTKIATFYSPAGGTGKTTLALAMAIAGAKSGMRILYLNLEEIDSVKDVLDRSPGCLTDVFLALKTKGLQAGITLKEGIGTEPEAGFYFISGVESISEYDEIDSDDIKKLLEIIRELSDYELVVIDQSSAFTEKARMILEDADVIFTPVTADEGSMSKLRRFTGESDMHGKYDSLLGKINLIMNKTGEVGVGGWELSDITGKRFPRLASIRALPVFSSWRVMMREGDMLLPWMTPLLQTVKRGEDEVNR